MISRVGADHLEIPAPQLVAQERQGSPFTILHGDISGSRLELAIGGHAEGHGFCFGRRAWFKARSGGSLARALRVFGAGRQFRNGMLQSLRGESF